MNDHAYDFDAYLTALGYQPGGDVTITDAHGGPDGTRTPGTLGSIQRWHFPAGGGAPRRLPRHALPGVNESGSYTIDDLAHHRERFPNAHPWWAMRRRLRTSYPDAYHACLDRPVGTHRRGTTH